jgi:A/G-specific adenine glycosylase
MDETATHRFSAQAKRSLQQRLLGWFASEARDLPWRNTRDLYSIWVSEIMLQQTQVATVIAYYERFLARFPHVCALAEADEHEVLRLWEGLGYYRRARQMHAAAQRVRSHHGGQFPTTFEEVLALPGIGRYTAGAILSIGRDERLPILEANTVRVLSRLTAYRGDPLSRQGQKFLWQTAEELLPEQHSGHFNQALMELGAMLCTPRSPSCLLCPVNTLCLTRKAGLQNEIPQAKKPQQFEAVTEAALVLRRADGCVLLRRRKANERWAGMWDFPRFPLSAPPGSKRNRQLREETLRLTGQSITRTAPFATIKHGVTRFRITLEVMAATVSQPQSATLPTDTEFAWLQPEEMPARALSTTGRKIAQMLRMPVP